MSNDKKSPSIDAACKEIEGLNIYGEADGSAALIRVAIEYSRQELANEGVDFWSVTSEAEVQEYCKTRLKDITQRGKDTKRIENVLALIVLLHSIKYDVKKVIKDRKCANSA